MPDQAAWDVQVDLIQAGVAFCRARVKHFGDRAADGVGGRGRTRDARERGRLELADLVASPRNPLTARVFVNRAWYWIFGTGIVATTDDFGHLGEPPSHPELLDYLASEFINEGWSFKKLVRSIVSSETFRHPRALSVALKYEWRARTAPDETIPAAASKKSRACSMTSSPPSSTTMSPFTR